jgi:DNA-binding FadR family transcriptional regulator
MPSDTSNSPVRFVPSPVQRPRVQVEDQLRAGILTGAFETGERLPSEARLAEDFSVSRTTVREALRALASAGLIHKVSGKGGGSFVSMVDHHALGTTLHDSMAAILQLGRMDYHEVSDVRRLIEAPAAGLAAEHRSEQHVERLREIIDLERNLSLDAPEISELDTKFHTTIAEASDNRLLSSFIAGLHGLTHPALSDLTEDVAMATFKQHVAIVRAIEKNDSQGAFRAMTKHLDYVEEQATRAA